MQGGGVEIGGILLKPEGIIESSQMDRFEARFVELEGKVETLTGENKVLTADNVVLKTDVAALKTDNVALKADNVALKTRVFDVETAAAAAASTGSSSGAFSSELAVVKADLASLAANHTGDMAELSETFTKWIVELEDHLAEVNTTLATTMSTVVYADGVHSGGDLDFTEGSASLAILKETLPGVKMFLSSITIKGDNVKGSVVSELLKDVAVVGGTGLHCQSNAVRFAADDDKLVFASLTSVTRIEMENNNLAADSTGRYSSPSSVSFPVLVFVPGNVQVNGNKRIETILIPNLLSVGGFAYFHSNGVLTSLQLPSLLNVRSTLHLGDLPKLTTGGVNVSQQFKSCGEFYADAVGFTCTTDNGLKAVLQGAASTGSGNTVSCKK